jgi:hypothetical protein
MKNILFIGKLSIFETQNSPNRYLFLKYLESKPNIKILNDNSSLSLKKWLQDNNKNFKPDVIIYYFLTRIPSLTNISIHDFKDAIKKYNIPSVMIFEDSHYTQLVKKLYFNYNFNYFINLNKNTNIVRELNFSNIPVSLWNQYMDITKFYKNHDNEKKYDFLLYGSINNHVYPLRNKILLALNELAKSNNDMRIKIISHNGIEYNKKRNPLPTPDELSVLINQSRFSFATSSIYNLFVKKYTEIPLSGATLIGDIPCGYENLLKNNIIPLNNTMSISTIKQILINSYKNKYIHIEKNIQNFTEIIKNDFNYNKGYNDLNLIINNILSKIKKTNNNYFKIMPMMSQKNKNNNKNNSKNNNLIFKLNLDKKKINYIK